MHRPVLVALHFVVLVGLLSGCTPLSERVARRTVGGSGGEEVVKQAAAVARFERQLKTRVDPVTFEVLRRYGTVIHACADRYRFDWRFILAVMKTESSFSSSATSNKGAYGLMQIMPVTGAELERTLDLLDIRDPLNNIQGGVYYLRQLYDMFGAAPPNDRLRLALASYNAGVGRVYDAQDIVMFLRANPTRWSSVRVGLAMLSSSECGIHSAVWSEGRPRSGCFNNAGETLAYVDKVMDAYARYKRMLE